MVNLAGNFAAFKRVKILVLGDFMVDTYVTGKVKRISPEAPVPVLHVHSKESRLGGAGNVVLNLLALGADVIPCGRLGPDREGDNLLNLLTLEGALSHLMVTQIGFTTPVKNRFIADSQQMLRVDYETVHAMDVNLEQELIKNLAEIIPTCDLVAISDYGKGFLSRPLLTSVVEQANKSNVPIIIDPKGDDFSKYRFATMIKPNLSEAYAAAKLGPDADLNDVAKAILVSTKAQNLMITRSEHGISLFALNENEELMRHDFPVKTKDVKDVTGAGDTVLALMSMSLANHIPLLQAAQLANIAAGISIEKIGCVKVTLADIAERLLENNTQSKIFERQDLFALKEVLKDQEFVTVHFSGAHVLSGSRFQALLEFKKQTKSKIVVCLDTTDLDFAHLITSLKEIDYVVPSSKLLKDLGKRIKPVKKYQWEETSLVEAQELVSSSL